MIFGYHNFINEWKCGNNLSEVSKLDQSLTKILKKRFFDRKIIENGVDIIKSDVLKIEINEYDSDEWVEYSFIFSYIDPVNEQEIASLVKYLEKNEINFYIDDDDTSSSLFSIEFYKKDRKKLINAINNDFNTVSLGKRFDL